MKLLTKTHLIFAIALVITLSMVYHLAQGRYQEDKMHANDLAIIYTETISEQLQHLLSATYPIAALIQNQQGDTTGFQNIAESMLPHYPGLSSLQLTRGGVIEHIVPLAGNEAALGKDIFNNPKIRQETLLAKESGNLVLTGPFSLYQGGTGLIGRLPIYLYNDDKIQKFWGFATTLIRLENIINKSTFEVLSKEGFSYRLSRIHPETHQIQVIAESEMPLGDDTVQVNIFVPGTKWTLDIIPHEGWFEWDVILFESLLAIIFSLYLTSYLSSARKQHEYSRQLEQQVATRTKTLNEHLKRLQIAFNTTKQRSFELNIKTGMITINDESSQGDSSVKSMSFTKKRYQRLIHPDDVQRVNHAYERCLITGIPYNIEFRERNNHLSWTWVSVSGVVVEWNDNKAPTRLIGIHTDINNRKKNEAVLRSLAESRPEKSKDIFTIIARQLASACDAEYAQISEIDEQGHHHAISTWSNELLLQQYQPNLESIRQGSGEHQLLSGDNLQTLLPEDQLLTQFDLDYYLSLPLTDNNDRAIGLITLIRSKPLPGQQDNEFALIQSLATRASNELEKQKFENKHVLSSKIFEQANEAIIITDPKGKIIDINPTFSEITGYSRQEAIGQTPNFLSSGRQSKHFYLALWKTLIATGHWKGEMWNKKKNGELYAELLTISALKDENGRVLQYVGLASDITEFKKQQQELELIAHYDSLTQLPNRALFADRFKQAILSTQRSQKQLAICFIDLDNFKPINDNYGHDEGDRVLIQVANRIRENIRPEDVLSRHGGDEFALLIQNIDSEKELEHMLTRLLEKIRQPYQIGRQLHQISTSIGITVYPEDDGDIDTLLRHADKAMYEAKLAGKNQIHFFNAQQNEQLIKARSKRDEIRLAIQHNQLQLYYQPKVNMSTGEVFGAEALIRWHHPKKGLVPPMEFLPLIDGTDLEVEVGNWVMAEAVKQLDQWQEDGLSLEMSINISSRHLQSDDFVETLANTIEQYPDLDTRLLQLEILESSELSDTRTIANILTECQKTIGVNIALDDFGTGYSALTHLRNLPANTIKIDQSFIRDMLDDHDDYAIVDGIIRLANAFDRNIIAEGVETTEHGLILLLMGCEYAQGYVIAKPLPADQFITWLEQDYQANEAWLELSQSKLSAQEKQAKLFKLCNHFDLPELSVETRADVIDKDEIIRPACPPL